MHLMNFLNAKEQEEAGPKNRLQRLAFAKGYYTASALATAVKDAGAASYGLAYSKWNGKAGKTGYEHLLKMARFLGANSVEEVFDP